MHPTKIGTPRSPSPPAATGKSRFGVIRLLQAPSVVALTAVLSVASPQPQPPPPQPLQEETAAAEGESSSGTLCNVPPTLSGEDDGKKEKIKHPKSVEAMRCTSKCVSTCILGGAGSPGIGGPFNTRRPIVVFKDDFRSRQYCLVECSDICNLIKDGEDGQ